MFYYILNAIVIYTACVAYHKFKVYQHAKVVDDLYSQYNIRPFKYDECDIPNEKRTCYP